MCGICGIINFDERAIDKSLLNKMCRIMSHRGPDDEGFYIKGKLGLRHRRLSIIDLYTGYQPMSNEDSSIWLVFNGEIYNFQELRIELEKNGHKFKTDSDTEVILHCYEEDGEMCLERLNGMFAFALWDENKKCLFLARDRIGVKPLYYYIDNKKCLFASEMKAILEDKEIVRELDLEAFNEYLSYNYIPAPKTMIKGINKIPPAYYLIIDMNKTSFKLKRYWHPPITITNNCLREEEIIEKLRELLFECVKRRLISDVPLGAFLSGGIDSTTVVAIMSEIMNRPVDTFSIGFKEEGFDESRYAKLASEYYHTNHHHLILDPPEPEIISRLVWHFDEPFADPTAIPTYLLSHMAREYVTVALSGDGGDELFGGYPKFFEANSELIYEKIPMSIRKIISMVSQNLPHGVRGKNYLETIAWSPERRYINNKLARFRNNYGNWHSKQSLLNKDILTQIPIEVSEEFILRLFQEAKDLDYLEKLLYVDLLSYLPENCLTKLDKSSMATSLEVRSPFVDYKLVEFAASLPSKVRMNCHTLKYLLKKVVTGIVPTQIIERPKKGFDLPVGNWIKKDWQGFVKETLFSSKAKARGIFQIKYLREVLDLHLSGKKEATYLIWIPLVFEIWCNDYL